MIVRRSSCRCCVKTRLAMRLHVMRSAASPLGLRSGSAFPQLTPVNRCLAIALIPFFRWRLIFRRSSDLKGTTTSTFSTHLQTSSAIATRHLVACTRHPSCELLTFATSRRHDTNHAQLTDRVSQDSDSQHVFPPVHQCGMHYALIQ
jgi:hypothetical protein